MNDEQLEILYEIHENIPRGGPGNKESTQKAFSMLEGLPAHPVIADIGCGPGMQTFDLIELTDGTIYAVDNHQSYLDKIRERAEKTSVADRIITLNKDMSQLDFEKGSLDLIWAEGSIYIIGFETGLKAWRPFLKENGYIVVTELTWFKSNPPVDVVEFWTKNYPGIQTNQENLDSAKKLGFKVIEHFPLPDHAWFDTLYNPVEAKLDKLRKKYENNSIALEMIELEQQEIDFFRKYSEFYGYEFYIMQA